jgi:hypothetical protein
MAQYDLIRWNSSKRPQLLDSSTATVDFSSIRIGSSNLTISEDSGSISFNDNPLKNITSITIGSSDLMISEGSGAFDFNNHIITNVALPIDATDVANKAYVDGVAQGLDVKGSVKAIARTALVVTASGSGVGKLLTATGNAVLTVDGVNTWIDMDNDGGVNNPFPSTGTPASRVLVTANGIDNCIYAVKAKGDGSNPFVLVRATDCDTNPEVTAGLFTFVTEGGGYADTGWVLATNDPIVLDADALTFTQFSSAGVYTGGAGIDINGLVINVDLDAVPGLKFVANKLAVKDGDGIQVTSNGVEVDLAAAGSGTGGLTIVGGKIAILEGDGLKLTSNGIETDLATAGANTGGLTITAGQLEVDPGLGIILTANGVQADLATAGAGVGGLEFVSSQIAIKEGEGLKLTSNGIEADLAAAGSGVGGLEIVSAQIAVKAGDGIELNVNGVSVTVGDGIQILSDAVAAKYTESLTNDNAGAITIRQVVYVKANGNVDLAQANLADLNVYALGVVQPASIASAAPGQVYVRRGAVISGYSGLTPGKKQFVSRATAGAMTESLAGFVTGEFVYSVGRALSSTQMIYDPQFEVEY